MNRYRASLFIRHLFAARSTAGHGVHSPYMFDFITRVIGGRCDNSPMKEVESLRKEMLADRRIISVTDLGAGSKRFSGGERRISDIAAAAALPKKEAALLARIAVWTEHGAGSMGRGAWGPELKTADCRLPTADCRLLTADCRLKTADGRLLTADCGLKTEDCRLLTADCRLKTADCRLKTADCRLKTADCRLKTADCIILELGTSLGISTLAMALATPDRRVVTVEGCPALAEIARANLRKHKAHNAEVLNMEFSDALKKMRTEGTTVSLAYIDGNHRGEALKKYVREIMMMGEEMIIVADDIYMNRNMFTAWQSLTGKETASAALGTFRLGMLFRLRNLTPGYYRVRY